MKHNRNMGYIVEVGKRGSRLHSTLDGRIKPVSVCIGSC